MLFGRSPPDIVGSQVRDVVEGVLLAVDPVAHPGQHLLSLFFATPRPFPLPPPPPSQQLAGRRGCLAEAEMQGGHRVEVLRWYHHHGKHLQRLVPPFHSPDFHWSAAAAAAATLDDFSYR